MLLGIDIGGTKTAVLLGDRTGAIAAREQMASPLHLAPVAMIDRIVEMARTIVERHGSVI